MPVNFGACLGAAVVSDYFDGVIARRLRVATAGLRRLDSIVDTVFYGTATFAAWSLYPAVIHRHAVLLIILVALEFARYVFDLIKFGREASYHMYSSKMWGLMLFIAFFSLLVYGYSGLLFAAAIIIGIVADLEGVAISVVLPVWTHDVPTLFKALEIRNLKRN